MSRRITHQRTLSCATAHHEQSSSVQNHSVQSRSISDDLPAIISTDHPTADSTNSPSLSDASLPQPLSDCKQESPPTLSGTPPTLPDIAYPQATYDIAYPQATYDIAYPQATYDIAYPQATYDIAYPQATYDIAYPQATYDIAYPQATYQFPDDLHQRMTITFSSTTAREVMMGTSPMEAFSPRSSFYTSQIPLPLVINPISQTMRRLAFNAVLSNGNAITQGSASTHTHTPTSPSPQVVLPLVRRPMNAVHEQPLYQQFNVTGDPSQPGNSWARDYELLLDLVTRESENLGTRQMIHAMPVLARIMNVISNIEREDQNFNNDFLDSLQLALEQFRENAVAYYNAN